MGEYMGELTPALAWGESSVTFHPPDLLVVTAAPERAQGQPTHCHTPSRAINQQLKMASRIRQNYKEDCEALVNKQINLELHASYVYMSMAYYFDRDDVAYSGFSSYFKKNSDEEREHGEKFIKYQNKRGGKIVFQDITKPTTMEWGTPLRPWRLPWSSRRRSTRVFSTCTRGLTVMLIFATSWRQTFWTNRWTPSRRSPSGLLSSNVLVLDLDIT